MLKYAILGAAMAVTVPALAQTAPSTSPMTPAPAQGSATTAPMAATPQTSPAPADPMQTAPATPAATETAAQPAAEPAQVASAVDTQFTTYDKDANGTLNATEFGAWMVALKTQTDPATDATSAATKKWTQAAFAQADTDKSKSVSKTEITGFLTPAKS